MTIYRKVVDGKILLEMVNDGKDIMIDCIENKVTSTPKPVLEEENRKAKKSKTFGWNERPNIISRSQSKNRIVKHTNKFPDLDK